MASPYSPRYDQNGPSYDQKSRRFFALTQPSTPQSTTSDIGPDTISESCSTAVEQRDPFIGTTAATDRRSDLFVRYSALGPWHEDMDHQAQETMPLRCAGFCKLRPCPYCVRASATCGLLQTKTMPLLRAGFCNVRASATCGGFCNVRASATKRASLILATMLRV